MVLLGIWGLTVLGITSQSRWEVGVPGCPVVPECRVRPEWRVPPQGRVPPECRAAPGCREAPQCSKFLVPGCRGGLGCRADPEFLESLGCPEVPECPAARCRWGRGSILPSGAVAYFPHHLPQLGLGVHTVEDGERRYCQDQGLRHKWLALRQVCSAPDDRRDQTWPDPTLVGAGWERRWGPDVPSAGGATGEGLPRAAGGAVEGRYWTGLLSKPEARALDRRQMHTRSAPPAPQRGSNVGLWREMEMGVACPGLRSKMAGRWAWRTAVKGCGEVRVVFFKVHRTCGPDRGQLKVKGEVKVKGKGKIKVKGKGRPCARV